MREGEKGKVEVMKEKIADGIRGWKLDHRWRE